MMTATKSETLFAPPPVRALGANGFVFSLVSIARSKPTAFEAVSFQQVLPLPFDGGADPLIRAGTPGPAFPQIDNSEEADEGVGCGPGGPPHKTKWHCAKCVRQTLEATFSRNQSYRLAAGSCLVLLVLN
jgi:hypothetical protein